VVHYVTGSYKKRVYCIVFRLKAFYFLRIFTDREGYRPLLSRSPESFF